MDIFAVLATFASLMIALITGMLTFGNRLMSFLSFLGNAVLNVVFYFILGQAAIISICSFGLIWILVGIAWVVAWANKKGRFRRF